MYLVSLGFYRILLTSSSHVFSETPLSLAVQCEPGGGEAIRVLVEGGAHIDFRAKDGLTAVHKAVRGHRHTALLVNVHGQNNNERNSPKMSLTDFSTFNVCDGFCTYSQICVRRRLKAQTHRRHNK